MGANNRVFILAQLSFDQAELKDQFGEKLKQIREEMSDKVCKRHNGIEYIRHTL